MSHDRKPGRVKVVQAAGSPQRRRGDGPATGVAANTPGGTLSGRAKAMLIVLFLLASVGTAVAVELQLPS